MPAYSTESAEEATLWSTVWVAAGSTIAASGLLDHLSLVAIGLAACAGAACLDRRAFVRRHATV